jgi:hypothetical protein
MREPTQICRGFTDEQWTGLRARLDQNDEAAWNCAVEVFERRIRERFLACIEALVDADSQRDVEVARGAPPDCSTLPDDGGRRVVVPGFAIMALCSLLIETLQSFRESLDEAAEVVGPCTYPAGPCIRPVASTTEQFKKFLRLPAFGGEFNDDRIATQFVRGVRNGILHEAETRGWVVWGEEPPGRIVGRQGDRYLLNRTEFYRALRCEFEKYLRELRDPASTARRRRFMKKMDDVAKEC